MWPEMKKVYDKTRHSQSLDSIKRINPNIKSMITTWMKIN